MRLTRTFTTSALAALAALASLATVQSVVELPMVGVLALSALLAVGVGLVGARSAGPSGHEEALRAALESLAAGRLDGDAVLDPTVRAGPLGEAVAGVRDALSALRTAMASTADGGGSGPELPGAFGAMTRDVLEAAGVARAAAAADQAENGRAVDRFLEDLACLVSAMAARDVSGRLTGSYDARFDGLKNGLNDALAKLDDALSETATVTDQVSVVSDQINGGAQRLAESSSEQAASIQEVSSSLQELASHAGQNSANAREAIGLTKGATEASRRGVEAMERLSAAMRTIKASSDSTAKIVKTIDEIAFQTNLLALNAAVEAARAGDAGRGFAVVAEEVRDLAMRSARAAQETSALIKDAVDNAEQGVSINAEVVSQLGEIDSGVSGVQDVIREIAEASEQQNRGVREITTAVEQMNSVTQSTAANAQESASASDQLAAQAREVRELIRSFTLSGAVAHAPPAVSPPRAPKRAPAADASPEPKGRRSGNGHGKPSTSDLAEALIPFGDAATEF